MLGPIYQPLLPFTSAFNSAQNPMSSRGPLPPVTTNASLYISNGIPIEQVDQEAGRNGSYDLADPWGSNPTQEESTAWLCRLLVRRLHRTCGDVKEILLS